MWLKFKLLKEMMNNDENRFQNKLLPYFKVMLARRLISTIS